MQNNDIENIEIELLIDAIHKRYGYDYSHYAQASLKRRINNFLDKSDYNHVTELIPGLLYDDSFFNSMLYCISVNVTEMFRDPDVYIMIRENVIPYLKTYPFIKIWHAGCATGEEVYSMAILLKEEGLYERSQIYATDINDEALENAMQGIYSVEQIKEHTVNYRKAGGKGSLSDYYYSRYDSVIMDSELKKNITFANHNLVTDYVFGEMHFIICRNVLIYFDKTLQDRVLNLFDESLINNGFLCIGTKEGLKFSGVYNKFKEIGARERIYQKRSL